MEGPHEDNKALVQLRERLDDVFGSLSELNLEDCICDKSVNQLAVGSSSDVFQAWSTKHNKRVVVKRIRLFLLDELSFAKSFEREIRLWSQLDHPNVLPLLGFFLEGPNAIPNLVSEYMQNGTVIDYMRGRPRYGQATIEMIHGISSGLSYLHSRDIIHADLKAVRSISVIFWCR